MSACMFTCIYVDVQHAASCQCGHCASLLPSPQPAKSRQCRQCGPCPATADNACLCYQSSSMPIPARADNADLWCHPRSTQMPATADNVDLCGAPCRTQSTSTAGSLRPPPAASTSLPMWTTRAFASPAPARVSPLRTMRTSAAPPRRMQSTTSADSAPSAASTILARWAVPTSDATRHRKQSDSADLGRPPRSIQWPVNVDNANPCCESASTHSLPPNVDNADLCRSARSPQESLHRGHRTPLLPLRQHAKPRMHVCMDAWMHKCIDV